MALSAIHMRTGEFKCDLCPEVIRHALKGVAGVRDVVAVPSMKLTSVLFDPEEVAVDQLRARLTRCGYDAELATPESNE